VRLSILLRESNVLERPIIRLATMAWIDVVRKSRIMQAMRTVIETPTFQKQAERV